MRDRPNDRVHREVVEKRLGRKLGPNEIVHHENEDKHDSSPANLSLKERGAHTAAHNKARPVSRLRKSLRMVRERKKLY